MAGQQRTEAIAVQIWRVLGSRPWYLPKCQHFEPIFGCAKSFEAALKVPVITQISILHSSFRIPRVFVAWRSYQVWQRRPPQMAAFNNFCHISAESTLPPASSGHRGNIRPYYHLSQLKCIHLPIILMLKDDICIFKPGSSSPSSAAQNSELLRAARQRQERHAWQTSESNANILEDQQSWRYFPGSKCFQKKSVHVWTMFQNDPKKSTTCCCSCWVDLLCNFMRCFKAMPCCI